MLCKTCGSKIENDERFCPNCGAEVLDQVNEKSNSNNYMVKNNIKKNDRILRIGIILKSITGLVFIASSLFTNYKYGDWFNKSGLQIGSSVNFSSYGGDAYTGIQNATAQTANNVRYLTEVALKGFELTANNIAEFSWIFLQVTHTVLILIGVALIVDAIFEYGKLKYNE